MTSRTIVVRRGSATYLVAMDVVDLVQEAPDVHPVPLAPPGVVGTFIAQGRFVGVVDPALRAEPVETPEPARLAVLLRCRDGSRIALLADSVIEGDAPSPEQSGDGAVLLDVDHLVEEITGHSDVT